MQTTIGSEYLPIVLHLRGAINTRLAYRCERIEREDKGTPQSGASCHRKSLAAGSHFLDLPSASEVVVLPLSSDSFGGNGN